jgi:lipopolysaccharide transport system ATP-binding protein
MSDVALRTVGLGKMYRIGGEREKYRTLRDTLTQAAKRPLERIRHPGAATHVSEDLWALRNVDLEVRHGEVLGIIGRNGAGKSTLLKVASHITEPTEGCVDVRGRVGSLLEVGTGFHPELTGRENIYLNGAILGMARADIRRRFDDIVDFSETGRFLDTPVKRYSSGMYVRLAFAVAAHLEPEILLVDEVLSVGDAAFQEKCLSRMGAVGAGGRTVVFISHNMAAVRRLCSRVVLLDGGRVTADGAPGEIVALYLRSAARAAAVREWTLLDGPGDAHCRLLRFELTQDGQRLDGQAYSSRPLGISLAFHVERPSRKLQVGFDLLTADGLSLFQSFHTDLATEHPTEPGDYEVRCDMPANLLNKGSYVVSPMVALYFTQWVVRHDANAELRFDVNLDHPASPMWYSPREGALAPALQWELTPLGQSLTSAPSAGPSERDHAPA